MKIIINGQFCAAYEKSGIYRFCIELLRELDKLITNQDITVVYPFIYNVPSEFSECQKIKFKRLPLRNRDFKGKIFKLYIKLTRCLYIGLSNNSAIMRRSLVVMHDTLVLIFSDRYSQKAINDTKEALSSLKFASLVLTISKYSAENILKYSEASQDRVRIIYPGYEHMERMGCDYEILKQLNLQEKSFVYALSSNRFYKNFKWVSEVAKRNPDVKFVIAGANHVENCSSGGGDNLLYTGYVTDEQNKALMSSCKLFVHPSLGEGFGLPPLEALYCGAKVAVANASCLPEIYKDCVAYFDPFDYDVSLDELINAPVAPPDKLFEIYSWKRSARILLDCIDSVT